MLSISEDGFGLYICSKVTGKCDAAFLHPSQMDSMNIDQLLVQIRAILKVEFVLRFAVSYLEVKFIQLPQFLGLIHLMHKSKMNVHSVIEPLWMFALTSWGNIFSKAKLQVLLTSWKHTCKCVCVFMSHCGNFRQL